MEIIEKIINNIISEVKTENFKETYRTNSKDFTRKRKITVSSIVFFVIGCVKTCLSFDIKHFINDSKSIEFTDAAMSKARNKLSFKAFRNMLRTMLQKENFKKLWKGYQILAIDGMHGELPKTKKLMNAYSKNKASFYPEFQASVLYDVLNHLYLDATFLPFPSNEREEADKLINSLDKDSKQIITLDRGYPSIALIKKMIDSNKKFIVRIPKNFLKEVIQFTKSDEIDSIVNINYGKKRLKNNKSKSKLNHSYTFSVRCIKVFLSHNDFKVLLTNLQNDEASLSDIDELYSLRWEIETSFNKLKNVINVETFIGVSENSVKQEFYSSLIVYNLAILLVSMAQDIVDTKKGRKFEYIVNLTKAIALLKVDLVKLFFTHGHKFYTLIDKIVTYMSLYQSPIRENRSFKRHKSTSKCPIHYRRLNVAVF